MLASKSIEQILAVLTRFRARSRGEGVIKAYQRAVDEVRKDYDVAYQTIGDLCRRRLGLRDINQFHDLLEKWVAGNAEPLMSVLIGSTEGQNHDRIRNYFQPENGGNVRFHDVVQESFTFRLRCDIAQKLKVLSLMSGNSLPEWLSRIVSQIVQQRYKEWLTTQIEKA